MKLEEVIRKTVIGIQSLKRREKKLQCEPESNNSRLLKVTVARGSDFN